MHRRRFTREGDRRSREPGAEHVNGDAACRRTVRRLERVNRLRATGVCIDETLRKRRAVDADVDCSGRVRRSEELQVIRIDPGGGRGGSSDLHLRGAAESRSGDGQQRPARRGRDRRRDGIDAQRVRVDEAAAQFPAAVGSDGEHVGRARSARRRHAGRCLRVDHGRADQLASSERQEHVASETLPVHSDGGAAGAGARGRIDREHLHRRHVAVAAGAGAAAVGVRHLHAGGARRAGRHRHLDAVVVDDAHVGGGAGGEGDAGQLAYVGAAVEREALHESRAGDERRAAASGGAGGGQERLHFHFGDGDAAVSRRAAAVGRRARIAARIRSGFRMALAAGEGQRGPDEKRAPHGSGNLTVRS